MIGNTKLVLDATPIANDEFSFHDELFTFLAGNFADFIFCSSSVSEKKRQDTLLKLRESVEEGRTDQLCLLGTADSVELSQNDLLLSLSSKAVLNQELLQLGCKKAVLLSLSDKSSLQERINFCHSNEVDLILADFLPDEVDYDLTGNNNAWNYFLDNFLFLGPLYDSLQTVNSGNAQSQESVLLIIDSESQQLSGQTAQSSIVNALNKAKGFDVLDVSKLHDPNMLSTLRQKIVTSSGVVSLFDDPGLFHQVHTISQFSGKHHFLWGKCSLSPIRFLHTGQLHPLLLEGVDSLREISQREKITRAINAANVPLQKIVLEENQQSKFTSNHYIEKLQNWLLTRKVSGIEECYKGNSSDSGSLASPSKGTVEWPILHMTKWAQGPLAGTISNKIVVDQLHPELKVNDELLKLTSDSLVEMVCFSAPHLDPRGDWLYSFLNKLLSKEGMSEKLEKLFVAFLENPILSNRHHFATLRSAIWPIAMWFDLLNPEKRKPLQDFLLLGENFSKMELRQNKSNESPFAWLLLFLLYQKKEQEALELLDSNKFGFNEKFIQQQRLTAIQVLWFIGSEDLAKETMESNKASFEFLSNRDLLLYSILAALTNCWAQAKDSYQLLFQKSPQIFSKANLLKPRNFWLLQALVYKKVGNSKYYESFLKKAEEVDIYWDRQKVLIEREIPLVEDIKDVVPFFDL